MRLAVSAETRAGRSPGDRAQDVDVVRGEVDGHPDVADAGRERTGPPARDRKDRRQPAGFEEPSELEDGGIEPLDVADLDGRRAGGRRRGHDPVGLGRGGGQRLLDEDGDPALDRGEGERQVGRGRGGDDDRVEVRLGDSNDVGSVKACTPDPAVAAASASASGSATAASLTPGSPPRTRRWFRPIEPEPDQPDAHLARADRRPGARHRAAAPSARGPSPARPGRMPDARRRRGPPR